MDICNKQRFGVMRVCTFPFLSSGPFLTNTELGKIRNLESGNLFQRGSREVLGLRWCHEETELTVCPLQTCFPTALGTRALECALHRSGEPTRSLLWADKSDCSEESCFSSWDTAKWKLPCDLERQSAALERALHACTGRDVYDLFVQRTGCGPSPSH